MKAVIVVAILALVAVTAICLLPDDDTESRVFPLPVSEEDKEYPPSDEARIVVESRIADLEAILNDPQSSHTDMAAAIDDMNTLIMTLNENQMFVTVDYWTYPTEMGEEYAAWNILYSDAIDGFMTTVKEALNGSNSETVTKALEHCDEDPATYLEYAEIGPELRSILERQNELSVEYNRIMGTPITNADEELDKFTEAIEVYIDLVKVNNEYAAMYGYDNYMEYAYENRYGRDYAPDDVDGLLECVDEAVLIYTLTKEALESEDTPLSDLDWIKNSDRDDLRPYIEPFMDLIDKDVGDILDYMYRYGLLYTDVIEGQRSGGFSASLPLHNSSVIYLPGGSNKFMLSLTHELGHASHRGLVKDSNDCLDVREIHSIGLEMLLCEYQELNSMYGGKSMTILELSRMSHTIILSGALTELENWAYIVDADKDDGIELTLDGLVEKFDSIVGMDLGLTKYIDDKYGFIGIHHIVTVPGYYTSYGISFLNAVDLWQTSKTDFDTAAEKYVALLKQDGIEGYYEAIELAGLPNMLERENAEKVMIETIRILKETYSVA